MSLRWRPPVEPSTDEKKVIARCKARKLFVFLREHRHEIFDEAFQDELARMYGDQPVGGSDAVAPALLAMVTILQAAFGVSDADAVEDAAMNRRWQLVLGCLGADDAPFSQGTLQKFRLRLIEHEMDKRLLDHVVELARKLGGFGHRNLRAAFDSSPLFGAGRVEDTFNLLGHAAREVVRTAARRLKLPVEEVALQAGIPVLNASSIKAGLDTDWDSPQARNDALSRLIEQVESLSQWLKKELSDAVDKPPLKQQIETMERIIAQDTEPDPDGGDVSKRRIRQGVAKERQISISDSEMRHGRKSKASRVDGYKRHVAVDLEMQLICAVAITAANRPEAEALAPMLEDLATQGRSLVEVLIDRGYLGAAEIEQQRRQGVVVRCKPFPLRNGNRYTKADFVVDLSKGTATCPQNVTIPITVGRAAHFPATKCNACPVKSACTTTKSAGRSLSIHPNESLHLELRAAARTRDGRLALRERTHVEHRLAHIGQSQGRKARYRGLRKNLLDARRHAIVANLHTARHFTSVAA